MEHEGLNRKERVSTKLQLGQICNVNFGFICRVILLSRDYSHVGINNPGPRIESEAHETPRISKGATELIRVSLTPWLQHYPSRPPNVANVAFS